MIISGQQRHFLILKIKEITFDEILPFWKILWSHIDFDITPKHSRLLLKGLDERILINYNWKPTFFGVIEDDKIVGVNSGFKTDDIQYRSRGLFVITEFRMKGIATQLLQSTYNQAKKEDCKILWSYPRLEALNVYLKFGFQKVSCFEENEFGTNCYVIKRVK